MIALVLLSHRPASEVNRMVSGWKALTSPNHVVVAYGGKREEFDGIEGPKTYIDDPRLRTRDHQRERQSYSAVLSQATEALEGKDWQYLYLAEYDMQPLIPDLWDQLVKRARTEQADLLGYRCWRLDDTIHPHYLNHSATPEWSQWVSDQSIREDQNVVLSCMGCGQFWRRDALEAVVDAGEPSPAYLELHLPTLAHHLGYRVRGMGAQDRFVTPNTLSDCEIKQLQSEDGWVIHPAKDVWLDPKQHHPAHTAPTSVILAGVVPPPVHGQSIATQMVFEAHMPKLSKQLIPIRSSKQITNVGKASLGKAFGLVGIIYRTLMARFKSNAKVLYYTPGSAATVPFIRDVVFLTLVRPFFQSTVLHYHSGGLPEYLGKSIIRSIIGRWIYGRRAWAISLSRETPVPGLEWGAHDVIEIPNGLDVPKLETPPNSSEKETRIVFLGNLFEEKGIFDLLSAAKIAADSYRGQLKIQFIGGWPDTPTRKRFMRELESLPDSVIVPEPEPLYEEAKWKALASADLFIFPTYYRSENLPLCVIEAMGMGLPVIGYRWRGMSTLVKDGVTGALVDPHDIKALAEKILFYCNDKKACTNAGLAARLRQRDHFTKQSFLNRIEDILANAAAE